MGKIGFLYVFSFSISVAISAQEFPLIIDNDCGVDDVIATTLQLLKAPKNVRAITIVPADSYAQPAAWVMMHLCDFLLPTPLDIPIGVSTYEGMNPFPNIWREDAWSLTRIPLWQQHQETVFRPFVFENIPSSLAVLTQVLNETPTQLDILETGPCTNIAEVLSVHPELKNKIHQIVMMGGALHVKGNVTEQGHDESAEWNIYNNPQAFLELLQSEIPLTLVSLDATQYTPIRKEFINQLKQNLATKSCQLVYESLQIIKQLIDIGQYLFWDTLTSAVVINPAIIKTEQVKINVHTKGPSMGKIFEDPQGFNVNIATWADQKLFETTVLDILLGH